MARGEVIRGGGGCCIGSGGRVRKVPVLPGSLERSNHVILMNS